MAGPVDPGSGPPAQGSLPQQREKPSGSPLVPRVLGRVLTSCWWGRGWDEVWLLKEAKTWLMPSGLAQFLQQGYSGSHGGA